MCKEESNEGEEDNPAKKLKLEKFKLDKETKALVDQDTVTGVTSYSMPFSFVLSYINFTNIIFYLSLLVIIPYCFTFKWEIKTNFALIGERESVENLLGVRG